VASIPIPSYLITGVFVILLLFLNEKYKTSTGHPRQIMLVSLLGIAASSLYLVISKIIAYMSALQEWDFSAFWIWGRAAAQGLNFYDPSSLHQIILPFSPSQSFIHEIINVGFWYPPQSILFFLPLGWLDIHTANLFWAIFNLAFLVLDIFLLWKIFGKSRNIANLCTLSAMLFLLGATRSTITHGQTNFIVLFFVLLIWLNITKSRSGIWIAMGLITKPIVGIFLLFSLLRRHWRVLLITFTTLFIISILTLIIIGPTTFSAYFVDNPSTRMPHEVYTEKINQSLLANILRLTKAEVVGKPMLNSYFLILGGLIVGISFLLIYRIDEKYSYWALNLTLLTGLLLYPATLSHYGVLLIIPILFLYNIFFESLGKYSWILVIFLSLVYALMAYSIFLSIFLLWFVFALFSFMLTKGGKWTERLVSQSN